MAEGNRRVPPLPVPIPNDVVGKGYGNDDCQEQFDEDRSWCRKITRGRRFTGCIQRAEDNFLQMQTRSSKKTKVAGDLKTMNDHTLDAEEQRSLLYLETSKNYHECIAILQNAISRSQPTKDPDLLYEIAAAQLRLSVYQMICGIEEYEVSVAQAKSALPATDVLALSADWLNRTGEKADLVRQYCDNYFELVGEDYKPSDSTSMIFLEKMLELRETHR
ncbi:hypothetical protein [Roseovarius indicus]|uniref:hypothetical protein n=1 Tax=Roseovarius indicus TaxID=540747 RepID=UPI000A829456|nr:hypothetical protein [Roseovarius indicus]